jgi:hypothetical protein
MATSLRPYLNSVRAAVTSAMCIRNLPCQLVRRPFRAARGEAAAAARCPCNVQCGAR